MALVESGGVVMRGEDHSARAVMAQMQHGGSGAPAPLFRGLSVIVPARPAFEGLAIRAPRRASLMSISVSIS